MAEIKITRQNFKQEVEDAQLPVLVDFWATWCGPCRMIAPEVEAIAREYAGRVKVGKVNVDEESELAARYQVASIPTLILFKNGQAVRQSVGYQQKAQIEAMFK